MLPKGIGTVMVTDKKSGKRRALYHLGFSRNPHRSGPDGRPRGPPLGPRATKTLNIPTGLPSIWIQMSRWTGPSSREPRSKSRTRLKKLGLGSFLKTTGGKGLHIVVPIKPEHDWNTIKTFTRSFVLAMEKASPKLYLSKMTKAARAGKIYLDYLRNERGATAVRSLFPRAPALVRQSPCPSPGANSNPPLDPSFMSQIDPSGSTA